MYLGSERPASPIELGDTYVQRLAELGPRNQASALPRTNELPRQREPTMEEAKLSLVEPELEDPAADGFTEVGPDG